MKKNRFRYEAVPSNSPFGDCSLHQSRTRSNASTEKSTDQGRAGFNPAPEGQTLLLIQSAIQCVPHPAALGVDFCLKGQIEDPKGFLKFTPTHYESVNEARHALLVKEMVRKFIGLPGCTPETRRAAAEAADIMSENSCFVTNQRLKPRSFTYPEALLVSRVQKRIVEIIGTTPPISWLESCDWGPGATATVKGDDVVLDNKYLETGISVTYRALPYARRLISDDVHWCRARYGADGPTTILSTEFTVQQWNRMVCVPKDAFRDRTICAEPTMNIFLQKGVGRVIRRALKRVGCDLDDQTRNQDMAAAAFTKGYSTIDLESASDTLSIETVFLLLPPDWAELLDQLRTPCTRLINGHIRINSKFSSMGNGFTFELESLIFYAIASVLSEDCSVYGDDIIVNRDDANDTVKALAFFGFKTNTQKTYITGSYFESCGKHFFKGVDITPVYQKQELAQEVELVRFHNRLYRYADSYGSFLFAPVLKKLRRLSDTRQLPSTEGDFGMIVPVLKTYMNKHVHSLWYESRQFSFIPIRNQYYCPDVYLAYWYRTPACTTDGPISNGLPFRDATRVLKKLVRRPV